MQIAIDIPEELYKAIKKYGYIYEGDIEDVALSIIGGKQLSQNQTLIPYLMHKEMGIPISECQKAYNLAIEYLQNLSTVKG